MELQHDTGTKDGHQSRGNSGHVIAFEAPRGTWWIKAVRIFGARYGGGYDAKETCFSVSVCKTNLDALETTEAPYDVFAPWRFQWVEIALEEPVRAPKDFKIVAAFDPAPTKGIFVGWSTVKATHSAYGLAGGAAEVSCDPDKDWMIRAVLSKTKPKGSKPTAAKSGGRSNDKSGSGKEASRRELYVKDFEFIERTVKSYFPALEKKGVDWSRVCKEWEARFRDCKDDETHILNARRLLAVLKDSHTNITRSAVEAGPGAFASFYGGGLWMASDRGRLVLRGLIEGHHFRYDVKPGAVLVEIDGRPARIVHEENCRRIDAEVGYSSRHFLEACLYNRFFHMERDPLPAVFLNPDGKTAEVKIPRWGPGGRAASLADLTLPEGADADGRAAAAALTDDVGYIRILGGMDGETQQDFFSKLDTLKDKRAIVLDCRGMGGGGDSAAWAMAGRFYARPEPLGSSRKLDPTGDWQFEGPVVMIQDSAEISSAETFTWAMTETGRAVSVGRPTGGATIIPRTFEAPSKLFSFRMGCTDRATPIKGIKPEGIGTPPDVLVPIEPHLIERHPDPDLAVAQDIALLLLEGAPRDTVTDYYGGILGADAERVRRSHGGFQKLALPAAGSGFASATEGIVPAMIEWELSLVESKHNPMPDFAGAAERLAALAEVAKILGEGEWAQKAAAAPRDWHDEIAAQNAWEELERESFPPDNKSLQAFRERYAATLYGKAVAAAFASK